MHNEIWCGVNFNFSAVYKAPYENTLDSNRKFVLSKGLNPDDNYIKVPAICWYTNLDHNKRHEELDLVCRYSSEEYPHYQNYDAVDVGKVQDIPYDYPGVMGVPDTIIGSFNPDQFEIVGLGSGTLGQSIGVGGIPKEHKRLMKGHSAAGDLYILVDGLPKVPYSRILIRNKHPRMI